jgi:putative ABC transport system ATP-binding protein
MSPLLSLSKVHYTIPVAEDKLTILANCSLSVQQGESVAIVGRSGSGKSTLLSLMAGLDTPTEGEIQLFGQMLNTLSENQRAALRAQQVGFIFQNFQLIDGMTALENVMLPLELFDNDDAEERARAALAQVDLSHRQAHYPTTLSGGEQQRVAIARAMVCQPRLIFADEPTGNLDETTAHNIQDLLLKLIPNSSLIIVTHDHDFAMRCQSCYVLRHGSLEQAS